MSPMKPVTTPRWLVVVLLLAAVGMPTAAFLVTGRVDENTVTAESNCEGLHKLVVVLDGMIAASRPQLERYGEEGTLSPTQVARALVELEENRAKLRTADCE